MFLIFIFWLLKLMVSCFVFEGQPGGGSSQNCMAIDATSPHKWGDIVCSSEQNFICECTVEEDLDT